jgi:molecular chaperone GrpE
MSVAQTKNLFSSLNRLVTRLSTSSRTTVGASAANRLFSSTRSVREGYTEKKEDKPEQKEAEKKVEEKKEETKPEEKKEVDLRDKKIEELQKKVEDLTGKYYAALAEAENTRKIANRDVEKAKEFGVQKLVKRLFDVVDTMNLVIQNTPTNNETIKPILEGMVATRKDFMKAFKEWDVEEFEPKITEKFDPNKHYAIFEMPQRVDQTPGTIGLVIKNGWIRKDILLRPAHVGVIAKSDDAEPKKE